MYSNILQIDRARLKRPINIFKGRTVIQAGVLGRQEPYETHQVEMQCSAVPGNDTSWELTRWERASCTWASHVLWQQRRTIASLAIWTRALPGDLGKQLALSTHPTRYWTTEDGSGTHSKKTLNNWSTCSERLGEEGLFNLEKRELHVDLPAATCTYKEDMQKTEQALQSGGCWEDDWQLA